MNCIICKKKINIDESTIPPKWYGKYTSGKLIEVICDDCIKKPENEKKW